MISILCFFEGKKPEKKSTKDWQTQPDSKHHLSLHWYLLCRGRPGKLCRKYNYSPEFPEEWLDHGYLVWNIRERFCFWLAYCFVFTCDFWCIFLLVSVRVCVCVAVFLLRIFWDLNCILNEVGKLHDKMNEDEVQLKYHGLSYDTIMIELVRSSFRASTL